MVETIAPVVYGDRARWRAALALHAAGALLAAGAFGAALGEAGRLLGAPWGVAGLAAVAMTALVYGLREAVPAVRVPVPQARRQVPDWWRSFFSWPASAALYGAGLGIGFFTYLAHGTLVVVALAAVASGRPIAGAILVGPFGLARGLSPIVARGVVTAEVGRGLVDRLASSSPGLRRLMNGVALGAVAAAATVVGWRARPPDPGAWSRLSAAALATLFVWASVSKLVARRRWIRTLEAQGWAARVRGFATWATPAAEASVMVLVLAGVPRAAGVWALVLLSAFSLATVRARVLVGKAVPCGCFGGRSRIDFRVALVRNAAIGSVAAFVAATAVDQPRLTWPGMPTGADVLPFVLASVGFAVALGTAWGAGTWLQRGGRS